MVLLSLMVMIAFSLRIGVLSVLEQAAPVQSNRVGVKVAASLAKGVSDHVASYTENRGRV